MEVAQFEDEFTFTRNRIVNTTENITNLIQAAQYLTGDYITRRILEELGDGDKADEIIAQLAADEIDRGFLTEDTESTEGGVNGEEGAEES